jgi:hypothetical protein
MFQYSKLIGLRHSTVNGEVWEYPSGVRISRGSGFQNGHYVECSGFEATNDV